MIVSSVIPTQNEQLYSEDSAMLTVVAEGSTCFCTVAKKDDLLLLCKSLKPEFVNEIEVRNVLRKELEIGKRLSSPYFVKYHELIEENGIPSLLMDYVDGRTVRGMLESDEEWFSSRDNLLKFFTQLLEGVKHLHEQQVVHLDLTPTNIMLTNINHDVRIIDLGYCYSPSYVSVIGTTQPYSAPELYDKKIRIDSRADIYSVGRVVLEIIETAYGGTAENVRDIRKIAQKCSRNNRAERYKSAEDVIKALQETERRHGFRRKGLILSIVAVCALFGAGLVWYVNPYHTAVDKDAAPAVVAKADTVAKTSVAKAGVDTTVRPVASVESNSGVETKIDGVSTEKSSQPAKPKAEDKRDNDPNNLPSYTTLYPFETISDPGFALNAYVGSTDDKSYVPFVIQMKNKKGINSYQVDVWMPSEECVFVRQPHPNSHILAHEARPRTAHPDRNGVGYFYDNQKRRYIITQTTNSEDIFKGTYGKVLTLYFDASSLEDGSYNIIFTNGLMHHTVDTSTSEHYTSERLLVPFRISGGKVVGRR